MPPVNPSPALPWGKADSSTPNGQTQQNKSSGQTGDVNGGVSSKRKQPEDELEPEFSEVPVSAQLEERPENAEVEIGLPPSSFDVAQGSRIEVKWEIEEDGRAEWRWWGAQIISGEPKRDDFGETYQLLYDEWNGFEAVTSEVRFLDRKQLYDLGCDSHPPGYLRWRVEGEACDADSDPEEEEQEQEEEEEAPDVLTLGEIHRELCSGDDAAADDEQLMQHLSSLPRDRQQHIAAGFRDMVETLKQGIGQIAGERDVITADDIRNIFRGLQKTE
uniref:Uncharacterized protein n=1 Tax=Tetraselmis sp. GSL018 TaxID=582737 RepID=A0A061R7G9_9CHLO|mmetsp:Transcript_5441/g.13270  ORF Transcript_5441/g.13270 Transcript_5441/m.13270 type:complete len:274 (-) Transcript_5441:60-881(-)